MKSFYKLGHPMKYPRVILKSEVDVKNEKKEKELAKHLLKLAKNNSPSNLNITKKKKSSTAATETGLAKKKKRSTNQTQQPLSDKVKRLNKQLKVSHHLYNHLEKHLQNLQSLDDEIKNKQQWIEQAIEEKLKIEDQHGIDTSTLKQKYVHVRLTEDLKKEIEKRVKILGQFRESYSEKLWLMDAIYEKLERDYQTVKNALQNHIEALMGEENRK